MYKPLHDSRIARPAPKGFEVDQIANDIAMSCQNVEHHMRFRNQMKVADQGRKRLQVVGKQGWTVNRDDAISTSPRARVCKTISESC
jgi:hypothetical protein